MTKFSFNLSAVIAIAALSLAGCGDGKKGGHGRGAFPVNVVAVAAKEQPIQEKISLVGTMAANESVEIKSEIDGAVEEINFDEGHRVKKGQLLISVDKSKLEASLAQAEANLKMAETTSKRYETLIETRAVSTQEFDQTQADLAGNKATVDLMKAQLNDAAIEAPFDGVMGARQVSLGQFIAKGASISFLINDNPMKAEFRVPERYLSRVKEKQAIELAIAAYPNEKFKGEVYFIDPQIDEMTRTALIKARVPNPDGKLRRGMFANLELIVNVREKAVVIPEIALIPQGEKTSVFVIDAESQAQPRPVKIGIRQAGNAEIIDGLKAGEKVIIEGFQKVGPGSKVVPKEPQAEGAEKTEEAVPSAAKE
jgi:membrane fusion protein, multidrug efflux system